jgi:hypothetical protein
MPRVRHGEAAKEVEVNIPRMTATIDADGCEWMVLDGSAVSNDAAADAYNALADRCEELTNVLVAMVRKWVGRGGNDISTWNYTDADAVRALSDLGIVVITSGSGQYLHANWKEEH